MKRTVIGYAEGLSRALKTLFMVCGCFMGIYTLSQKIALNINVSGSLPYTVFLTNKGQPVTRGDYVTFWPPVNPFYSEKKPFIKLIGGVAGDSVRQVNGKFYINNTEIGTALSVSAKGIPLSRGPTGFISEYDYFVYTQHPRSFDSRYGEMGWIHENRIIGRAYPLF